MRRLLGLLDIVIAFIAVSLVAFLVPFLYSTYFAGPLSRDIFTIMGVVTAGVLIVAWSAGLLGWSLYRSRAVRNRWLPIMGYVGSLFLVVVSAAGFLVPWPSFDIRFVLIPTTILAVSSFVSKRS